MSQREYFNFKPLVSLIPNGPIQFIDIQIDQETIDKLSISVPSDDENKVTKEIHFVEIPLSLCDQITPESGILDEPRAEGEVPKLLEYGLSEKLTKKRAEKIVKKGTPPPEPYQIKLKEVFDLFKNCWIPLPFFRIAEPSRGAQADGHFRDGPTDWARCFLKKLNEQDGKESGFHLTLAFDTSFYPATTQDSAAGEYAAITEQDVNDGACFAMPSMESKYVRRFITTGWVKPWLKDIYADLPPNTKKRDRPNDGGTKDLKFWANYLTLLSALKATGKLPDVQTINDQGRKPIEVDLVLDIGNSRTVGMLIPYENDDAASALEISNCVRFELRDFGDPTILCSDAFDSSLTFKRQRFGDPNDHAYSSGRESPSFYYPSVARVGPEGRREANRSIKTSGETTISSPKRYLWDLEKRKRDWVFSPDQPADKVVQGDPVTSGVAGRLNNFGFPFELFEKDRRKPYPELTQIAKDDSSRMPPDEPRFCRSSMMFFLIAELVSQALIQINAPEHRAKRALTDTPRQLKRLILTVPPAMTVIERERLKYWAKWSIDQIWAEMKWPRGSEQGNDFRTPPTVQSDWDEASTTQMVFLFNEIMHRYGGDGSTLLKQFGQRNKDDKSTLRVASIDIGGGTTDLIIMTYIDNSHDSTCRLEPKQEFREGFNIAGDDLLKQVIERHIVRPLVLSLGSDNGNQKSTFAAIESILGPNTMDQTASELDLKARITREILVPEGERLLAALPTRMADSVGSTVQKFQFNLFNHGDSVKNKELIERFKAAIKKKTATTDEIFMNTVEVNLADVEQTIDSVLRPAMKNLLEVIEAYNCDFLLLSGRPSRLLAIKRLIYRFPPLAVHRIIPLDEYEVDSWYPFATKDGQISDPKSTCVVGGMLSAMLEGRLRNIHIATSKLKIASTIRFVGTMDQQGLLPENGLIFKSDVENADDELNSEFLFSTRAHLGFRQLPLKRWQGTPYYVIDFKDTEARLRGQASTPYRVTVAYSRKQTSRKLGEDEYEIDEGRLRIEDITPADSGAAPTVSRTDLVLKFQTMRDDAGHWIDTGCLSVPKMIGSTT